MYANRIPEDVAAAIEECWPDAVIGEFDADESYFRDIHAALERDLRKIPGASMLWQTEAEEESSHWGDDDEPPLQPDFQSYHVFFLAAPGSEFEFETETEAECPEDPEDPDVEIVTVTVPGNGWHGCSVSVSFASPFAAVCFADYAQFEDGSLYTPDVRDTACDQTGKTADLAASYRKALGEDAFATLENLRARIVKVLARHGVVVMDQAVLDLPAPGLRSDSELFLEGKELLVADAFFFRGV